MRKCVILVTANTKETFLVTFYIPQSNKHAYFIYWLVRWEIRHGLNFSPKLSFFKWTTKCNTMNTFKERKSAQLSPYTSLMAGLLPLHFGQHTPKKQNFCKPAQIRWRRPLANYSGTKSSCTLSSTIAIMGNVLGITFWYRDFHWVILHDNGRDRLQAVHVGHPTYLTWSLPLSCKTTWWRCLYWTTNKLPFIASVEDSVLEFFGQHILKYFV